MRRSTVIETFVFGILMICFAAAFADLSWQIATAVCAGVCICLALLEVLRVLYCAPPHDWEMEYHHGAEHDLLTGWLMRVGYPANLTFPLPFGLFLRYNLWVRHHGSYDRDPESKAGISSLVTVAVYGFAWTLMLLGFEGLKTFNA